MKHQERIGGPGRRDGGLTLWLLFLLAIAVAVGGLFMLLSQNAKDRVSCDSNLKKVFRALELYEVDRGSLPTLAYFPSDPQNDADSIVVALESYGADSHICVCPAMHSVLRELGLTYIWNAALSGQHLHRNGPPVWVLVEMTAINSDLPTPHLGHYNVLFSDGTVRRVRDPLKELSGL